MRWRLIRNDQIIWHQIIYNPKYYLHPPHTSSGSPPALHSYFCYKYIIISGSECRVFVFCSFILRLSIYSCMCVERMCLMLTPDIVWYPIIQDDTMRLNYRYIISYSLVLCSYYVRAYIVMSIFYVTFMSHTHTICVISALTTWRPYISSIYFFSHRTNRYNDDDGLIIRKRTDTAIVSSQ